MTIPRTIEIAIDDQGDVATRIGRNAVRLNVSGHGPLDAVFWDGSLTLLTPSNSGSYPELPFVLRGVGYNVRAELYLRPDGTWDMGNPDATYRSRLGLYVSRVGTFNEPPVSSPAQRDLTAMIREIGLWLIKQRPDLPALGAVARRLQQSTAADQKVGQLQRELDDARIASETARASLRAAIETARELGVQAAAQ